MTNTAKPTVAIVGTGIGGTELAGYLGLSGFRVRCHDIRPQAVNGIAARKGLDVEGTMTGFAPIERATTDCAEAVQGADLIVVSTLNNDHQAVARQLTPLLNDGQVICLMPGCVGGSLEFRSALDQNGSRARIVVGEMDNFPFTGQILGPAHLRLASIKRHLLVAGLPSADGPKLAELVRAILPQVGTATNVLQTGLGTMNPVVHVPGMLANIGWIESGKGFQFYGEGLSERVTRLVQAVDNERLAVAQAYQVQVPSQRDWLKQTYGLEGGTLYNLMQRLQREVFKVSPAPDRLDHRYVVEDVPFGLVPIAALGLAAKVPTPVCDSLTTVASTVLARDFKAEGRTLERMGLSGLSQSAILSRVS